MHHSKLVKAWAAERQDPIELFYLPSYSPQLNPEERLNAALKQEMGKRVPIRTNVKLRQAANDHMAMLAQNPERVMSYFQDRQVRCAASHNLTLVLMGTRLPISRFKAALSRSSGLRCGL